MAFVSRGLQRAQKPQRGAEVIWQLRTSIEQAFRSRAFQNTPALALLFIHSFDSYSRETQAVAGAGAAYRMNVALRVLT